MNEKSYPLRTDGRMYGRTDPNYRKALLLKMLDMDKFEIFHKEKYTNFTLRNAYVILYSIGTFQLFQLIKSTMVKKCASFNYNYSIRNLNDTLDYYRCVANINSN